jgi:CheY-like chemotaxis protein
VLLCSDPTTKQTKHKKAIARHFNFARFAIRSRPMALHDFDKAHAIHASLLSLLVSQPGGKADHAVVAHVSSLCDAALDAINDVESRVAIRGVKSLALLLYSDDPHVDIGSGSLHGADALRFQIMNALSMFRARVDGLERRPQSRPEVPAIAPKKTLRVLVVEDNRDSAETLAKLLELCGYSVSVAYTAMEGLEAAKRTRPDVVLCDIGLPDSDGFALAEALHEDPITSTARLIAVTAYGQEKDRERSKRAGFQKHLVKPVAPAELLRLLDEDQAPSANESDSSVIDLAAHKNAASGGTSGAL